MAMTSKAKKPNKVVNPVSAEYYEQFGNTFVEEGTTTIGYRYDQVERRKMRKPDGKEFTNNVTLSQPSSEVLTIMKDGEKWFMVMGKQSRSPYVVEVNGTLYSKIFLEQAAGLVEADQDFQSAAIAEGSQELGAKMIHLSELIVPKLYRHVSYTDEVSKLYLAVTERLGSQNLDADENINVDVIPLEKARIAFKEYINGDKADFLGFDLPDITMLSMTLFFWKVDSGEIDLNNLTGNLL